jgi:hypothetical protein
MTHVGPTAARSLHKVQTMLGLSSRILPPE